MLVDHLVPDSKESRIADAVMASPGAAGNVLIVGHPYVDVWAAVKPSAIGKDAWPTVPRNLEWKKGVCQAFGWPHRDQADIARAWKHILGKVTSYADLEPSFETFAPARQRRRNRFESFVVVTQPAPQKEIGNAFGAFAHHHRARAFDTCFREAQIRTLL